MNGAQHPTYEFWVADTWTIDGSATDEKGAPLDLTNAQSIAWEMVDLGGNIVASADLNSGVTIISPATAGLLQIVIQPSATATIPVGAYRDRVKVVTASGFASTQTTGAIAVQNFP